MATLEMNVQQVNADFQSIKNKIVERGVEVAEGTKTSEYAAKVGEVYEAGKKAEYEAFWNTLQRNGARNSYANAFTTTYWVDSIFNPMYPIKASLATSIFSYSGITDTKVTIDFSSASYVKNNTHIFGYATKLRTIRKIIVDENTIYSNWFTDCTALKNITVEGTIGNDISFADCPLTVESAWNVALALKDFGETVDNISTPKKLTISDTTWGYLGNIDEANSLYDHCANIGWILEVAA